MNLNHLQLLDQVWEESGKLFAEKIRRLVEPYKSILPQVTFIASFSSEYGCSSQDDWMLRMIQYDVERHRLIETLVQYACIDMEVDWTQAQSAYFPLPRPVCHSAEKLGFSSWLEYNEQIIAAVLAAIEKSRQGQAIEIPIHKVTRHPLLAPKLVFG